MHMPSRVQPICTCHVNELTRYESTKPGGKSRLKRLFERHSRTSSVEKITVEGPFELEPNSVCLAKMVRNFVEENDKPSPSKSRCNCFNGSFSDNSDDELSSSGRDARETLKSLVPCASVCERNLLADTSKIVEKNKTAEKKFDKFAKIVRDGLVDLGYDAAICASRWEKTSSHPAGEYEYIDVIVDGVRLIIDIDFRSEFEIARSTNFYKAILQILPTIFVGKSDRLLKMISIVSEAAKQSLEKKGMPCPPWRKADYIRSKWLSAYTRTTLAPVQTSPLGLAVLNSHKSNPELATQKTLISTEVSKTGVPLCELDEEDGVFALSYSPDEEEKTVTKVISPEVRVLNKSLLCVKVVTGFVPIINGNKP